MMKKFSISTQLLILVFTILLCTSIFFIVVAYFSLEKVARDQTAARMKTVREDTEYDDMPLFVIRYENNEWIISAEVEKYLDKNEFLELYEKFKKDNEPKSNNRKIKENIYVTKNGNTIYFEFKLPGPDQQQPDSQLHPSYFIFTDNTYPSGLIRDVALRMFSTFLAILFVAVMCIYFWSTNITKRLKNIQNHIIDLPKSKYEKEYVDNSLDEIGELSRSVEVMRKEIGHNENTKQEMLQNLSHDFKTPIAVIKSYAEALQDGMAGPEAIDTIIDQAENLKKKVNRLLQYNSLEYLTKDKPFEDINMTELVNRVVANYRFQTKNRFILDLEDNVIFQGYHENWSTVVENILDNAKRYAKNEIRITLRKSYLKIYNDGEHIDEQFLNSVFKPYEKGSKGQFGLGMSIVKKTVDFFGMNMVVRNEEGIGVSFVIKKNDIIE